MFCFFRRNKLTCRSVLDAKDEQGDHIYKSNCDEVQVFHELKDAHQFISSFATFYSRADFGKTGYWFSFQLCLINSKANREFFNDIMTFCNTRETLVSKILLSYNLVNAVNLVMT